MNSKRNIYPLLKLGILRILRNEINGERNPIRKRKQKRFIILLLEITFLARAIMDFELWLYFSIVFLGLQGLYRFSKSVALTLLMVGNILILQYSLFNYEYELLVLTIMMMIAQLTRIWGERNESTKF